MIKNQDFEIYGNSSYNFKGYETNPLYGFSLGAEFREMQKKVKK